MADANEATVQDVEHIDLSKVGGGGVGSDVDDTKDDDEGTGDGADGGEGGGDQDDAQAGDGAEGGEGGNEPEGDDPANASPDGRKERLVHRQPNQAATQGGDGDTTGLTEDALKVIPGESPRERAMRLELTKTRTLLRGERRDELMGAPAPAPASQKKELTADQKAVLGKYKPEELASLKEVMPILAEEMGFVRADQLQAGTYSEKASGELDTFLSEHPDYLPENDHGNVLWDRFKNEFAMYKQPANPRDYRKIFNRIHTDIFGIQPASGGKKGVTDAQRHNVGAGSQRGSSGPVSAPAQGTRAKPATSGLRLDMLKGFDEDELKELESEAG